jgi:hypothetical protein
VAVCRSRDSSIVAVGTTNIHGGTLKICPYPSLVHSVPQVYSGHSAIAADVSFLASDEYLVSVGGHGDSCVILWSVVKT